MKTGVKKWLAVLLCVSLSAALLTGCGAAAYDPKTQVKGNLDAQYLNQYSDEYLSSIVNTKEDLEKIYEDGLEAEAEFFESYFKILIDQCSDTVKTEIVNMYSSIYSHAKYEIGDVSESGNTYLVNLTIYPIDIVQKVMDEDFDTFVESWKANDQLVNLTDDELETAWAEGIIALFNARLNSIGYLEPETLSIQVEKNSHGYYAISDNDFSRINSLIIRY